MYSTTKTKISGIKSSRTKQKKGGCGCGCAVETKSNMNDPIKRPKVMYKKKNIKVFAKPKGYKNI